MTKIALAARTHTPLAQVFDQLFHVHRTRSLVGARADVGTSLLLQRHLLTYALVLTRFYDVPANDVGWYILPFAIGNVLGPLHSRALVRYVGRKIMISFTYIALRRAACRNRLDVRAACSQRPRRRSAGR